MHHSDTARRAFLKTLVIGTVGTAAVFSTTSLDSAASAAPGPAPSGLPATPSELTRGVEARSFRKTFGGIWERIAAYTVEVAEAMPEEHYDFKPTPEVRTFKEEILHIANSDFWIDNYFSEGLGTGDDYDTAGKTRSDCVALLDASFKNMTSVIENLTDDDLHTTVNTFAGEMNRMDVLWFMRDHITHHRAKTVVALRLKDITPPSYIGS